MPADWSRPVDVDRLADAEETREFDVELAEFPRLAAELGRDGGRARGSLSVSRERRVPVVEVEVEAQLPLVCQRCLGVVEVPVASSARVAVVPDLAAADALSAEFDPCIADQGRVVLRDIAEEQLLLALPLVARHDDEAQCQAVLAGASAGRGRETARLQSARRDEAGRERAGGVLEEDSGAPVTQKPFAELGELLKRKR
jgi:uncharacterized protein